MGCSREKTGCVRAVTLPTPKARSGAAAHRFSPDRHQFAVSGLLSTHRRTAASPSAPSAHPESRKAFSLTHTRSPVMGTLIFSATAILVVMGFSDHALWLAAIVLLFLYVRYGRTGGARPPRGPRAPPRRARAQPRAARTTTTGRTATVATARPGGNAATGANAPSGRAARNARSSTSTILTPVPGSAGRSRRWQAGRMRSNSGARSLSRCPGSARSIGCRPVAETCASRAAPTSTRLSPWAIFSVM